MRYVLGTVMLVALVLQGLRAHRLTDYESLLGRASEAYDEGDGDEALYSVEKAMDVWSGDQEVWAWLGDAASYRFRHPPKGGWTDAQAEDLLRDAWAGYAGSVLRCPADSWSWSGLADVALRRAHRRDQAQEMDLAELDRRAQGILAADYAVAIGAAKLAVKLQPSGYQQLDVLARIYESTGDVERARETYVLSARMMPAPSFHVWGTGRRLLGGLYEAILTGLREGIARAPLPEKTMLNLEVGQFARAQGDFETSLEYLRTAKAAAQEPFWKYQSSWALAGVLEAMGRFPEALEELSAAHAFPYDRASVSHRLGSLEARLGRFEDACRDLRDALRDTPGDTGLRIGAAQACRQANDFDTAEQVLRDGLVVPNENLGLARALLDLYREEGRSRVAEALVRTWAREYPDQAEFQKWATELEPIVPGTGLVRVGTSPAPPSASPAPAEKPPRSNAER